MDQAEQRANFELVGLLKQQPERGDQIFLRMRIANAKLSHRTTCQFYCILENISGGPKQKHGRILVALQYEVDSGFAQKEAEKRNH